MSIKKFFISLFVFISISVQAENKSEKDLVKNIQAKVLEDGFSIQITWTPPEEEGEIIIGRSKERLDTPEKLYYADSLGRYPNKGDNKLSSFKDMNLKPGVYYYAVVMVSRVKKRDVILIPNQNYTYDPIDIGQPTQIIKIGKNEILPYAHDSSRSISDIEVKTYKDYNQIRWAHPLNAEKTRPTYHLYRSEEPLSSIPLLKQARKIVELKYPDNFYVDKNIVNGKIYCYGVSVSIEGEEFLPLVEHKSFIRTIYAVPTRKEEIRQEKLQEKTQEVVTPSSEKLSVIEASKPENKIETKEEPAKKEVATKEIKNRAEETKIEVPAREVPTKGQLETKKSEKKSHVQDINYEFRGDGVFLTWAAPEDAIPHATIYRIYLFNAFPKNPEQALQQGKGIKLGEVVHPEMSFDVPRIDRKRVIYLAVSVKHGIEQEQFHFIPEESLAKVEPEKETFVKKQDLNENQKKEEKTSETPQEENPTRSNESVVTNTKETHKSTEDSQLETEQKKQKPENLEFEYILNEYYKKKKYEKARNLFDRYSQKETESKNKAKALFYSALCDYNLGNYESSLNKLLQKEMKNFHDQDRVDFYINRCTEKTK